ncbi:unnamed protein product [Albugo candida]|nr:unnamed protein product [Albugo candida]|eukprot:CCI40040.1 unnamed protein product [Albugo candida]
MNHTIPPPLLQTTATYNHQKSTTSMRRDVQRLAAKILSFDTNEQLNGVSDLRELLFSHPDSLIGIVLDLDLVPLLMEFLQAYNNPPIQIQSAWALTRIVSNSSQENICSNLIPILCELTLGRNDDVCEQAIWSLGYLARASTTLRDYILDAGVMMPMLIVVKQSRENEYILRTAMWTISNFFRHRTIPDLQLVGPVMEILRLVIDATDQEVLIDACCTLLAFSTCSEIVESIIENGICERVIDLLSHSCEKIQSAAIQIVGNVLAESEHVTKTMLELDICLRFPTLMKHPNDSIRRDVCWAISNVTAVSKIEIQTVIDAHLIPILLHISTEDEFSVKREAIWALSNAICHGTRDQVAILIEHGCEPIFFKMLKTVDVDVLNLCLDTLKCILSHKNVLLDEMDSQNTIQSLQYHPNKNIAIKATEIIDNYADEDTTMADS